MSIKRLLLRSCIEAYLGKLPVISISLKDVEGANNTEAAEMLGNVISEEANRFEWLMESDRLSSYDKRKLDRILAGHFDTKANLCGSLKFLSKVLYKHYGKK